MALYLDKYKIFNISDVTKIFGTVKYLFYWVSMFKPIHVSNFTWWTKTMTSSIDRYWPGYSCILVLITSAGCVTTEARTPAIKPQVKWHGAARSPDSMSVIRVTLDSSVSHLHYFTNQYSLTLSPHDLWSQYLTACETVSISVWTTLT